MQPSKELFDTTIVAMYDQGYDEGYERGYDVATACAESRIAMGLPIEYGIDLGLPPIEDDDA